MNGPKPHLTEVEVFTIARAISSPDAREQYLAQVCQSDAKLRRDVEELLAISQRDQSFLESPPPALHQVGLDGTNAGMKHGAAIGPYKILEVIGEGGMGNVYMAEQVEPVHRKVALKVIKPGMDSKAVIARFDAERQALALMDHPNIANFYDAGISKSGSPFFVMELIKGRPIIEFCEQHKLSLKQKLDLFAQICNGVQHAHQKGIIHRDLKPSNVLVARYDDQPVAKVIDFGVAKAVGERLTDKTFFTRFGQLVGTLEYMSPEQAQLNQLDVDTRSDIYSLGAILYELLTGTPPFEKERLSSAAFEEVLRMLREDEPDKPSTRISKLSLTDSTAETASPSPAGHLNKRIPDDLDWIVMKCLEKDRARRYANVATIQSDIQSFLLNRPVSAGPPSLAYRTKKLVSRNKAVIGVASIVTLSLLIGLSISIWQAIRATQAEADLIVINRQLSYEKDEAKNQRANAVKSQRMAELMLEQARQAVDQMYTQFAEEWLKNEFLYVEQRAFLEKAITFYEQPVLTNQLSLEKLDVERALALRRVGQVRFKFRQIAESQELLEQSIAIWNELIGEYPNNITYKVELTKARNALAQIYWHLNDKEQLERISQAAINDCEFWLEDAPSNEGLHLALANAYTHSTNVQDSVAASKSFTKAVQLLSVLDESSSEVKEKLASTYRSWANHIEQIAGGGNDYDAGQVREKADKALELYQELYLQNPKVRLGSAICQARNHIATSYLRESKPEKAVEYFEQNTQELERLSWIRPDNPVILADGVINSMNLGLQTYCAFISSDRHKESHVQSMQHAIAKIDRYHARFPEDHEVMKWYQQAYSNALRMNWSLGEGFIVEGIRIATEYIERLERKEIDLRNDQDPQIAKAKCILASLYSLNGDKVAFDATQKECLRLTSKSVPNWPDHERLEQRCRIVTALCSPKFFDADLARETCNAALAEVEHPSIYACIGEACYRAEDWGGALDAYQKCLELRKSIEFHISDEQLFFYARALKEIGKEDPVLNDWWKTAESRWNMRQLNAFFSPHHRQMVEEAVDLLNEKYPGENQK